jgi:pimeloyl-ACP methyl ester carboxylesterase
MSYSAQYFITLAHSFISPVRQLTPRAMRLPLASSAALLTGLLSTALVSAQATGSVDHGPFPEDLNGSNFTYPWPVKLFRFSSQLRDLEMAFMDVAPAPDADIGRTAVLLHGKNFCAATWEGTVSALTSAGFRVVVPDQIGFCKSSKAEDYQYSLHQFAWNTRGLLDALDVGNVTVIGHSMGGMVATRFGLQYPRSVDSVVLVNSIGLEDYIAEGVPYIGIEQSVKTESASNYTSIRNYQQQIYYVGEWKEEYDVWVNMSVNIYHGSQRDAFVKGQARVVDMVLTQPVAPHFSELEPRTLLLIGEKDRTAIGSNWSPDEIAEKLGRFDELGPKVLSQLQHGELMTFPEYGHAPQISHPDEFHESLVQWLVDF